MVGYNSVKITCECKAIIPITVPCSNGKVGLCRNEHGDTGWRLYFMSANGKGVSNVALNTEELKKWGIWYFEGEDRPFAF